jgi:hypothetical protein
VLEMWSQSVRDHSKEYYKVRFLGTRPFYFDQQRQKNYFPLSWQPRTKVNTPDPKFVNLSVQEQHTVRYLLSMEYMPKGKDLLERYDEPNYQTWLGKL